MANVVSFIDPARPFVNGRGLRIDNQDLELAVIKHDGSTNATITSTKLRRIASALFVDEDGAVVTPTVAGYGTKTLTITNLPADNKGITVLLKGSKG